MVASRAPPSGDLAHNPGMCPDWELNRKSFGSLDGAQSTEPHQPGPKGSVLSQGGESPLGPPCWVEFQATCSKKGRDRLQRIQRGVAGTERIIWERDETLTR